MECFAALDVIAFLVAGEVPVKRVERKCQQLENLVTAVLEVAQPGDVIVDFCSGGVRCLCTVCLSHC